MPEKDLYVHSDKDVYVPAHLNFGKYIIDRLRLKKYEVALENSETREKLTYAELTEYAVNLSASLIRLGIGRGDTVAIGSEKRNEILPTLLAVVFTGAAYTPFDINNGRVAINHKIKIVKPNYLICSNLFWKMYKNKIDIDGFKKMFTLDDDIDSITSVKNLITEEIDINNFEPKQVQGQTDVAIILYSSGTTGLPKAVQLTHLNCIISSLPEDDATLKTALLYGDWYHNYDTFISYKFISAGRKIVYVNKMTLEIFLNRVQDFKIDIAFLIPSVVEYLSKSDHVSCYNLDSLRVIYSRSAPLHSKTIQKVKERLPKLKSILQGYGMTEAGELTSETWANKGPKAGSVGKASPGNVIKVVDTETHEVLGPNKHGEIRLQSPAFMMGYIGVDRSAYLDEEGFFKTGDLGYYDDDKYIFIVDRLKDVIAYDGNKFSPLEIETILLLHPGVREAGVIGKPVPIYGEEPVAFVIRNTDIVVTEKDLVDYVAAEVSSYMRLRGGVKFIDELPRNSRGKILRRQLRDMLNNE